ncbi:MAG TPA: TonB-dependent receptor [Allosphingosinicella sp.]|nr:TonB-dependent receptor [Allosphingosinicella sp.]
MRKILTRGMFATLSAATAMSSTTALAQATDSKTSDATASGVEEIVVTAQKREQNLQDVPISVAVLGKDELTANRITSLLDVGSAAPGVSVRRTPGGLGAPQIVVRGVASSGGLPGSDKSISINIDGVYIGANYGLTTDMPDLVRVEALRGPQGTLFGRNSTGGAISFITADPTGEFGVRQEVSVGNFNQFRTITHLELPRVGAFSGYVSYMHNKRDGDIKNLQSGIVFDRSNAPGFGLQTSAKTLGANKTDAVRAAVKFKPSDTFDVVYKFDWAKSRTTAEGSGITGYDAATAAAFGLFGLNAALALNPPLISGTKRPKAVRNAFAVPGKMTSQGHTLTANLNLTDQLTLKSISAYRKVSAFGTLDNMGFGQMFYPGSSDPFYALVSQNINRQKQWSEELQLNYNSDFVTVTAGALYYKEKVVTGSPDGLTSGQTIFGLPLPGNVLPSGRDITFLTGKSLAGYGQAEFHVTPKLDIVGGIRVTQDKKHGNYFKSIPIYGVPLTVTPFNYNDTRTTYLAGVNYHVTDDILTYAKFSTGYISGGSVAGVAFAAETAKSWEAGIKSELLDRRLRVNLTGFYVKYGNLQQGVPGDLANRPDLALAMINYGNAKAKGFEAEATAVPIDGLTLYGAVAYTDFKFTKFTPMWAGTIVAFGGSPDTFPTWIRPSTTANLSATYETRPGQLFGDARLMIRFDTNYRSKVVTPGIFTTTISPVLGNVYRTGGNWISNARIALSDIGISAGKVEIAGWARNLFNNRGTVWGNDSYFVAGTTYESARTYGIDLIVNF